MRSLSKTGSARRGQIGNRSIKRPYRPPFPLVIFRWKTAEKEKAGAFGINGNRDVFLGQPPHARGVPRGIPTRDRGR